MADGLGGKFKIVENAGIAVKSKVSKSKPWALELCSGCDPCTSAGKPIECRKRNIVYETRCKACEGEKEKKGFVYVGEITARSSRERFGDHISDLGRKSEKSHMHKHMKNSHEKGESPNFSYKIIKFFKIALE